MEDTVLEFLDAWGVEPMRVDVFRPYLDGPRFALAMWATGEMDGRGCEVVGYVLVQGDRDGTYRVIFHGADFCGSPMDATDSDESVASLLSFITLRQGDIDDEYFLSYSPAQLEFAEHHGESLALECSEIDPTYGVV